MFIKIVPLYSKFKPTVGSYLAKPFSVFCRTRLSCRNRPASWIPSCQEDRLIPISHFSLGLENHSCRFLLQIVPAPVLSVITETLIELKPRFCLDGGVGGVLTFPPSHANVLSFQLQLHCTLTVLCTSLPSSSSLGCCL